MAVIEDIIALVIGLIINIIVISPVLWLAGRALVGGDKARFIDAIWIVVLGSVIGTIFQYFSLGWIGAIIMLIVWLGLIKHFFDTGWLKAFAIAIIAIIIYIIIIVILALLFGVALIGLGLLV